jgi:hypothetical protein
MAGVRPRLRGGTGYPVLLALLGFPAPDSVLWLRVWQAVLTTAGVALTFLVGNRLVGRPAALAAAGVYALDSLTAVPAALAVVPVAAVWTACVAPSTPLRRAGHAAVMVLVCLLVLAPWTYRNYQLQERIVVVSNVGTRFAGPTKEHGVAGALAVSATRNPLGFARRWDESSRTSGSCLRSA